MIRARCNPMSFHERGTEIDFVPDQFQKFEMFALEHLPLIVVCGFAANFELAPVLFLMSHQCVLGVLSIHPGSFNIS